MIFCRRTIPEKYYEPNMDHKRRGRYITLPPQRADHHGLHSRAHLQFQDLDQVYATTQGGRRAQVRPIIMLLYDTAFKSSDSATRGHGGLRPHAMVVTLLQWRLFRKPSSTDEFRPCRSNGRPPPVSPPQTGLRPLARRSRSRRTVSFFPSSDGGHVAQNLPRSVPLQIAPDTGST